MSNVNNIIDALIENELAEDRHEALEIIAYMRQEITKGETIADVLSYFSLSLDYENDLLKQN